MAEAKMWVLCKDADRLERVYLSHNKDTSSESPDRKKYVSQQSFEKKPKVIKHHEEAFEKCGGG